MNVEYLGLFLLLQESGDWQNKLNTGTSDAGVVY